MHYVQEYYQDIMPDQENWNDIIDKPLPTAFWVNTLKISPEKLVEYLRQDNITLKKIPWHPYAFRCDEPTKLGVHWTFLAGLLQIQEEVSMLPGLILDPKPGETVLDMCAAPGNKTAQFSVQMNNQGTLIANDRNYGRMRALGQISKRLGLMNISTTIGDATGFPRLNHHFDKVLVDAPCGCEGTFRKSANKKVLPNEKNSQSLANMQLAILKRAVGLCKPGGRIIYSTCTFSPQENEWVIDQILKDPKSELKIIPIKLAGFKSSPGITQWKDERYSAEVTKTLRVWPHQNNTGGFYVALIEKVSSRHSDVVVEQDQFSTAQDELVKPYIKTLQERFHFKDNILEQYHYSAASRRGIYMINSDNQPATKIKRDASGLFAIKTQIQFPKLTTAPAMLLGKYATQNIVELNKSQVYDYFRQKDIDLKQDQLHEVHSTGYVLVKHKAVFIGVGLYFSPNDNHDHVLRSLFPKYVGLK